MKPKALKGEEFLNQVIAPVVRRDEKGNLDFFHPKHKRWTYWIEEKEIQTRRGLIRWILHLSGKDWITTQHICELITISHRIAGKDPHA